MTNALKSCRLAGPMLEGIINNHVEIHRSDPCSKTEEYNVLVREDFQGGEIPKVEYTMPLGASIWQDGSDYFRASAKSTRRWKKVKDLGSKLPLDDAKKLALDYGREHDYLVILNSDVLNYEVLHLPLNIKIESG